MRRGADGARRRARRAARAGRAQPNRLGRPPRLISTPDGKVTWQPPCPMREQKKGELSLRNYSNENWWRSRPVYWLAFRTFHCQTVESKGGITDSDGSLYLWIIRMESCHARRVSDALPLTVTSYTDPPQCIVSSIFCFGVALRSRVAVLGGNGFKWGNRAAMH